MRPGGVYETRGDSEAADGSVEKPASVAHIHAIVFIILALIVMAYVFKW
jgi:hypothetical protein